MREIARRLVGGVWRTVDVDESGGDGPITPGVIQVAPFSFSSAELKAATSHELVATIPGSVIVPLAAYARYEFVTTAYGDGFVLFVVNGIDWMVLSNFLNKPSTAYAIAVGTGVAANEQIGFPLTLDTADFSVDPGDATLSGEVLYTMWTP